MAEQERREPESPDGGESRDSGAAAGGDQPAADPERDPLLPADEDAAWAEIVAGYGQEPPDPPGARPFKPMKDLPLPDFEPNGREDRPEAGDRGDEERAAKGPLGSSVSFAPGIAATPGPRDYATAEPSDDDLDGDDEGHFVPPEPPPLPEADVTSKFAWLAVVGGPVLLLLSVLLGWDMTWWLATLCIGGFLGGFATLVARMQPGDDEDDDPGRGAVV
ncbi:hypothetical protein ACFW9D_31045 [Streptomyces sp. NPDC059524]|uniref:hypothetical protein n=1 Tax=Streptomyces sp. NPDC059524 TaxID=3346856 RepID=UPI00368EB04F